MKRILFALLLISTAASAVEFTEVVSPEEVKSLSSFIYLELCEKLDEKKLSLLHIRGSSSYERKSSILGIQDSDVNLGCSFIWYSNGTNYVIKGAAAKIVECLEDPTCLHLKGVEPSPPSE